MQVAMKEQFSRYLPMEIDSDEYSSEVQLQYVPSYSFGHEIPVLHESGVNRLSLYRSYMMMTQYLVGIMESDV